MKNKQSAILFFAFLCGVAVLTLVVIVLHKNNMIIEGHDGHSGGFGGGGHGGGGHGGGFGGGGRGGGYGVDGSTVYEYDGDDGDDDDDLIIYPTSSVLLL